MYRTGLSQALESRSVASTVESTRRGVRQVDATIRGGAPEGGDHFIQIKSGDEHLSRTERVSGGGRDASSLSNEEALARDRMLGRPPNRSTWIFEGHASGPLIREALENGVYVVQRVEPGVRSAEDVIALLERAGMTRRQINARIRSGQLTFIAGDRQAVIDHVVSCGSGGS